MRREDGARLCLRCIVALAAMSPAGAMAAETSGTANIETADASQSVNDGASLPDGATAERAFRLKRKNVDFYASATKVILSQNRLIAALAPMHRDIIGK